MTDKDRPLSASDAYKALLQTEEWRRFSNHVRDLYRNVCQCCRLWAGTCQVHHHYYEPGRLPWEYSLGEVTLLCGKCHKQQHGHLKNFRKYVFPKLKPREFQILNGALLVGLEKNQPLFLVHAIASMCASPESVKRFALDGQRLVEGDFGDKVSAPEAKP